MAEMMGLPPDLVQFRDFTQERQEVWQFPHDVWAPVWERFPGKGIVVAVADTGFSAHPDLPEPLAQRSFIRGESPSDPQSGHGTHCCGTAVGREGIGAASEADLIVAKVLSNRGSGSSQGIAAGIRWAADQGADIISLSLGGPGGHQGTNDAIDHAWSKGCIVNAAAGNAGFNGRNTVGWPAKYSNCLCCGATRQDGRIANFSSGGRELDYAAPGERILSTSNRGRGYTTMSGTSMATPWMSGFWACVVQAMRELGKPSFTAAQAVREFVQQFVEDRGEPGKDNRFGFGVPNMATAADALQKLALEHM